MTVDFTVVINPLFGHFRVRIASRDFEELQWMHWHNYAACRSDSISELRSAAFGLTTQNFGMKVR